VIARIGSALRRTARIAVERPRATLWALLALTAALFAVGLAAVVADNVERWTEAPHGGASMVVYLGEGVDDAHAHSLAAELATLRGVEHVELVDAAESAHRLQLALGADSTLLEGVELASLPASVEVTLAPGVRDVIAMSPTVRALRGAPGVDDVVVEDAGTDRVASTLGIVRIAARWGAVVFGILALIIALAAVRVRLERRGNELAVAHLLGAPPSFVTVPTALAGAIHGALAALLAAAALWAGVALYGDSIAHGLQSALGSIELALPPLHHLAIFIGLGGALGFIGGVLAGATRATS
jgi:cell division transport system permease protein